VLGAGAVSEQVVATLRDRGIADLLVMNRSGDRAGDLAQKFNGNVVEWADWEAALLKPDVVVSSVSADEPVLSRRILEAAMNARGNRALFLMDLGMPRNIEAAATDLYNLYVYNLDDLSGIVQQNRQAREGEIPRAEAIVEDHVGKFLSWQASVELVGLVQALRARLREERTRFLHTRLASVTHLTPKDREHMEVLMDELLEKLLVEPAERLRGERELRRKIQNVEALRDLFLSGRDKL
jgi:glutamyl-tRNA reductase